MDPVRKIIHIDMDAFFASVEQRDRPELRGRPVAVGGSPDSRGVVAAASYEARRFGVRSAMPCSRAARLCPRLVFVRPDFARYKAVSRQLHAIFRDYTDLIEPLSLDEAFLDVTENKRGIASATLVAEEIRRRVREELHLTCSAGVSSLKFVAKIASDQRKPDGLTVVPPHLVVPFLAPLPVRRLWGVGPVREKQLHELGLQTIGQVASLSEPEALRLLGSQGLYLWRMARGDDPRPVRPHRVRKSRSAEHTFEEDVLDRTLLEDALRRQAERIFRQLADGPTGRTATLKLRYGDFTTITRASSQPHPIPDAPTLAALGIHLLHRTEAGTRPVRLIGLGMSSFDGPSDDQQLSLPLAGDD